MATPLLDNVTLTANAVDNSAEFELKNSMGLVVHLVYNKGTENHMHIQVSFSTIKDDDGAEIWCDWARINQVSGSDHHLIENDHFKIKIAGNYRFPLIPISPREDKIRIRLYADTPGAAAGTATIYIVNDKYTY